MRDIHSPAVRLSHSFYLEHALQSNGVMMFNTTGLEKKLYWDIMG